MSESRNHGLTLMTGRCMRNGGPIQGGKYYGQYTVLCCRILHVVCVPVWYALGPRSIVMGYVLLTDRLMKGNHREASESGFIRQWLWNIQLC